MPCWWVMERIGQQGGVSLDSRSIATCRGCFLLCPAARRRRPLGKCCVDLDEACRNRSWMPWQSRTTDLGSAGCTFPIGTALESPAQDILEQARTPPDVLDRKVAYGSGDENRSQTWSQPLVSFR